MQEGYICKDCNYTSDTAGNCPYCDMPMEPIDGIDETTGEVDKYKKEDIGDLDEKESNGEIGDEILDEDELDEIIEN